jgi:6-phosphogluconolactonase
MQGRTIVRADAGSIAAEAANWIATLVARSDQVFRLCLSGGSTPRRLYSLLASQYRDRIAWDRISFFWGDERFVPHDNPDSNFRMARETLFDHVAARPENVHPIPTGGSPADAARSYQTTLQGLYGATRFDDDRPLFDLVLLGLGDDGHTASLLPGQPVLAERDAWVAAVPQGRNEPRITLTYPTLESTRAAAFLVTGAGKASAVRRARNGDTALPAACLKPQGELIWFLDSAAAGD